MASRAASTARDPEIRVVEDWHSALNAGDVERLVELSHTDVEVGGPRGSGTGEQLLREWVERANIRLIVRRLFHWHGRVVAQEDARWHDTGTEEASSAQSVGTIFTVRDGRVASVLCYPGLDEALEAAGLDASHEATSGS